jgi:hypothetical protein
MCYLIDSRFQLELIHESNADIHIDVFVLLACIYIYSVQIPMRFDRGNDFKIKWFVYARV